MNLESKMDHIEKHLTFCEIVCLTGRLFSEIFPHPSGFQTMTPPHIFNTVSMKIYRIRKVHKKKSTENTLYIDN